LQILISDDLNAQLAKIAHRRERGFDLGRLDGARKVYDLFVDICPVVFDATLADADTARDLLQRMRGISARDAVHAAVMTNHGIKLIAMFDAGFDRIPGIQRFLL
jgi:predicted nucleic acid-binding protein